ncbi:MAG: Lrp/AsnC family transcriptional regulator [Clostridia bacterium]|nr:Lrp/AsnC family transcriptional regulator [Clostridia bacterium]
MDKTDVQIINELAKNSDVTTTTLSKKINLSIPAVNKRIQNLKSEGIIERFTIITDCKKVNKPITAFVLVVLKSANELPIFLDYVLTQKNVLECYSVTGEYDCILKVCATSVESLDDMLQQLKTQNGVVKSYTMLSLTAHKNSPTVLPD